MNLNFILDLVEHFSLVLICDLRDSKLFHRLDKLVFIKLFIAIQIVLSDKLCKFCLESLRFLDSHKRVLIAGKSGNDLIHGQELVTVYIETTEG